MNEEEKNRKEISKLIKKANIEEDFKHQSKSIHRVHS